MRDDARNRTFPVGLYGTLLVGLIGLTFPAMFAPVEQVARTIVTLPLRAYSILLDSNPVLAASRDPSLPAEIPGRSESVLRDARGPMGYSARVCRVLERRVGPLGLVDELTLDCTQAELQGCAPLVTAGKDLLGFLVVDETARDSDFAKVRLLHYRRRPRAERTLVVKQRYRPARVAAKTECNEPGAAGELRFLVEPARSADEWPLRCTLLDDSYLGAKVRRGGGLVYTCGGEGGLLPAGLVLGRLMIWGYPELNIPVGLFVEPNRDPRGISTVVLWEAADGTGIPQRLGGEGELVPVRFTRFPAPRPALQRWMVTSHAGLKLPDGAAFLDRGRLLGTLQQPWSGQSLVTPFAASTRVWALLLRGPQGEVQEVVGRVVGRREDGRLRLEVLAPRQSASLRGDLFTGSNGTHCPSGLHIGVVTPAETGDGSAPADESSELWLAQNLGDVEVPQVYVHRSRAEESPR